MKTFQRPLKSFDTPAAPSYHLLPNEVTVNDQFRAKVKRMRPIAIFFILTGIILILCKHVPLGAVILAGTLLYAIGTALSWDALRTKEDNTEKLKESVSIDRAFMLAEMAKAKAGKK
jgi:hypothetical protein